MITVSVVPRVFHILKSVTKDFASTGWMKEADKDHISTWF
jgi:hypothetical protein